MLMSRRCGFGVATLCFLVWVLPAAAAENALDAFSTDAGVVVRIKAPQATTAKVADLFDKIVPSGGEQVRAREDELGSLILNPTLAGVDMQADWWLAIYPRAGGLEPAPGNKHR